MEQELDYVEKAKEWLLINGADFLVNLVVFLVILIVGKLLIGAACSALRRTLDRTPRVSDLLGRFAVNVTSKVLWVLVFMVALQRLGISVGPFIAGLGVTGFIAGFAFQESLGNLASGLMIALNQPFKVGDYVEMAGVAGVVKDINMMAATLSTVDNKKVVVPNKSIWGSAITNYTAHDVRRVDMTAGISYTASIGKAIEVVNRVLKENPLVLADPAPAVEVVEMGGSSVNLVVRPWCKTDDYWSTFFSCQRGIKEAFDRAGVEIPFPQMDVHLYQGGEKEPGAPS